MKRVISLFCVVVLCLISSVSVFAQTLETDRECSLSLKYATEGVGFENLNISLYKVASAKSDGTFETISPFDSYEVSIYDITDEKEWSELAETLSGYIQADGITPASSALTDSLGDVNFSELSTGLYLVDEAVGENIKGAYTFAPFMMYLPNFSGDEYDYDIEAKPKAVSFEPLPEGSRYRLLKLWNDAGHTEYRPESIKVDIVKDGEVFETVTLSKENNWSYQWTDNGQSNWSVAERDVPKGYKVSVDKKTTAFVITNEYDSDTPTQNVPTDSVQTGDTRVTWPYVLAICLLGFTLIIVGLLPLRGHRYEKKNR